MTRLVWLGAAVAVALGCPRSPADPVTALLDELTAAAEDRDADRFGAALSEGFRGRGGLRRPEAVSQLRRYFAAYESVGLSVYGVEVDRSDGSATVRCVVEFSGRARSLAGLQGLLPPSAVYRFTLETAEEAETWRVQSADWERVATDESR